MKTLMLIAAALVVCFSTMVANAIPVQVELSGHIMDYPYFRSPASVEYFGILPGDEFSCFFTYDPDTIAHRASSNPNPDVEHFWHQDVRGDLGINFFVDSDWGSEIPADTLKYNSTIFMATWDSESSSRNYRNKVDIYTWANYPGMRVEYSLVLREPIDPITFNGEVFPEISLAGMVGNIHVKCYVDNVLYSFHGEITMATIVQETPAIQEVYIDIKPGSDKNPINLKSKGVVPVAVFGTDDFDVTLIDDPLDVALFDMDTQVLYGAFPVRWAIEDIDRDGYDDMILHFSTQELRDYLDQYSVAACLMGLTVDGQLFMGTDAVSPFIKGKRK